MPYSYYNNLDNLFASTTFCGWHPESDKPAVEAAAKKSGQDAQLVKRHPDTDERRKGRLALVTPLRDLSAFWVEFRAIKARCKVCDSQGGEQCATR